LISFSNISCDAEAGPSVQTIFARLIGRALYGHRVLLFQKRFHAGIVDGSIRLTVRRWATPRVKPGGRYRVHPIGVVEVDALQRVTVRDLSEADARAAGFSSRAELVDYLRPVSDEPLTEATQVFRVALHHGGDGDRVPAALEDQLTSEDVAELTKRLARLDGKAPWTRKVLQLIRRNPRVAASKLAKKLGRETEPFKVDVRKLKRLGLTQSFEVGYEVSPRGVAFLAWKSRRSR
jgi:hypothetical protein